MTDSTRELRRFRAWAKKQSLDLERSRDDRNYFLWSDTQLAWEAWQAGVKPLLSVHPLNRVRIAYGD